MSIIISPPQDASPAGSSVPAGSFWPAIDLNDFRQTMRVGNATIPDPRLIAAINGAIITANKDLRAWKAAQIAAGYIKLADVPPLDPDADIGANLGDGEDQTELTLLWQRAVLSYATADLIETHPDVTATKAGIDKAAEIASAIATHQRNGLNAIRDIKGCSRVSSELI